VAESSVKLEDVLIEWLQEEMKISHATAVEFLTYVRQLVGEARSIGGVLLLAEIEGSQYLDLFWEVLNTKRHDSTTGGLRLLFEQIVNDGEMVISLNPALCLWVGEIA